MIIDGRVRVLFFCGERSPWGYAHLEALLGNSRFEVVGVVLATENRWEIFRRALNGGEELTGLTWKANLKRVAAKLLRKSSVVAGILGKSSNTQKVLNLLNQFKVSVLWCEDANTTSNVGVYHEFDADVIFSAAYPQIFKHEFLLGFSGRVFNSHPSLLPRCQGAHPVFWAIASGEKRTGSTIHIMTPELDQGDVVAQIEVELLQNDTRSQLYAKLITTIPPLLDKFADFLAAPEAKAQPQNRAEATYFRNDRAIHRRIFWTEMDATQIHNLVRACDGTAYFWYENHRVLVQRVERLNTNRNLTNNVRVPVGTVVDNKSGKPIIAVRNGFVKLEQIQTPLLKRLRFDIGRVLI